MGYAETYGDGFHRALESDFPSIDWRAPIPVANPGRKRLFACRYCIAAFGLSAQKMEVTDFIFGEIGDCLDHIDSEHPEGEARRVQ